MFQAIYHLCLSNAEPFTRSRCFLLVRASLAAGGKEKKTHFLFDIHMLLKLETNDNSQNYNNK